MVKAHRYGIIISDGAAKTHPAIHCKRSAALKKQAANSDSKFEKEKLDERVAKLSGGVAVIRVGAATETEMKYLKDKIEDAVNATKAAIAEGIVPGGGAALLHVSDELTANLQKMAQKEGMNDFNTGYDILARALLVPINQIALNAGREDQAVIVKQIRDLRTSTKKKSYGYDANKSTFDTPEQVVVDMYEAGIIDPVKVTRSGVENAASAAAVLLTTEAAIADEPEEKKEMPQMGGGDMGM